MCPAQTLHFLQFCTCSKTTGCACLTLGISLSIKVLTTRCMLGQPQGLFQLRIGALKDCNEIRCKQEASLNSWWQGISVLL